MDYRSPAIRFIAKASEFDWLPLPLLKCLPLYPSTHSLEVAANTLVLASTNTLEFRAESINSKFEYILLTNQDFATTNDNLVISQRMIQHIWSEWKTLIFAPNLRIVKISSTLVTSGKGPQALMQGLYLKAQPLPA